MINQVCNDVIHPKDFFQEFQNIEKVVDLFAVGVHEDYKRQGIATKLVEKSMEVRLYICTIIITMISDNFFKAAKSIGCEGAFIIATNYFTNFIAQKLQMKHYRTVFWKDYNGWYPEEKMPSKDVNSYYKLF